MNRLASSLAPVLRPITPDRVLIAIVVVLAALFAIDRAQALASLAFTGRQLLDVAPFLAASIALAAYAKASGADNVIARAFRGRTAAMVVLAALMGALSPFCSCGVIPLIAALLSMGVPLAAVMAFWLASPLMDPSMFVLTTAVLGLNFALFKTASAIGLGLLGGYGMLALQGGGRFQNPLRQGVGDGGCGGAKLRAPGDIVWRFWQAPDRLKTFFEGVISNGFFLGKWLALAFLLESLMLAYIPAEKIAGLLGQGGILAVVSASVIGVPAYLNGYAALPLVSGLIDQGMAPSAGMAFLIAGGVTSIPAAIAVFALARAPVFIAYVAFAFAGSVMAGLAYGLLG